MTTKPKSNPIPIKYSDNGEPITVVVTCESCGHKTYNEAPVDCFGCGKFMIYGEE
jgi:hypothetical protein